MNNNDLRKLAYFQSMGDGITPQGRLQRDQLEKMLAKEKRGHAIGGAVFAATMATLASYPLVEKMRLEQQAEKDAVQRGLDAIDERDASPEFTKKLEAERKLSKYWPPEIKRQ